MTMSLRSKVPKSKRGTRAPEPKYVPVRVRGMLHLIAYTNDWVNGMPLETLQVAILDLTKANGWELLSASQIGKIRRWCQIHNYKPWFPV